MSKPLTERRKEERRTKNGEVRLYLDSPESAEIRGHLIDISTNGFRVSHHVPALPCGQEVRFCHAEAQGRARVVWNCVVGGDVKSGFVVLPG